MEVIFRSSARALFTDAYGNAVIHERTKDFRPARFAENEQHGNQQYILLVENEIVCFGSINTDKALLVVLFTAPHVAGHGLGNKMLKLLITKAKN